MTILRYGMYSAEERVMMISVPASLMDGIPPMSSCWPWGRRMYLTGPVLTSFNKAICFGAWWAKPVSITTAPSEVLTR